MCIYIWKTKINIYFSYLIGSFENSHPPFMYPVVLVILEVIEGVLSRSLTCSSQKNCVP